MTMAKGSDYIGLMQSLKNDDTDAFEDIYRHMAAKLLQYVNSRVRDRELSEEIVQEVFISLWVRRHKLGPEVALESYLFSAAKYQVLSHVRSEKVRHKYAEHFALFVAQHQATITEDLVNMADLKAVIDEQISQLPPKCQQAFRLSRYAYKSIPEIAEEMGISTRTVENYITQALKHLRKALSQSQWALIALWFYM